jgi:hypothetical protein
MFEVKAEARLNEIPQGIADSEIARLTTAAIRLAGFARRILTRIENWR